MDFGAPTAFERVVVGCDFAGTLAGGWGKTYTQNRDVQGSNDGTSWTTIVNTGTLTQGIQEYSTPGESWRYVRITSGSDYLALTEFYCSL